MFNDLHGFITFFVNYFVYIFIIDKSWRTVTALGTKVSLQCLLTSVLCTQLYFVLLSMFCTECVSLPCKLPFRLFLHLRVISFTQGQKWQGNEELKYLYAPQ